MVSWSKSGLGCSRTKRWELKEFLVWYKVVPREFEDLDLELNLVLGLKEEAQDSWWKGAEQGRKRCPGRGLGSEGPWS